MMNSWLLPSNYSRLSLPQKSTIVVRHQKLAAHFKMGMQFLQLNTSFNSVVYSSLCCYLLFNLLQTFRNHT